jgi:predicted site-specific integrase-resolvase
MVNKLSLQEYANLHNISLVTVNKRINKGLINSVKEGNRRYILKEEAIEDTDKVNEVNKPIYEDELNTFINHLQKEVKYLKKEVKRLNKQLEKKDEQLQSATKTKEEALINYGNEMKRLSSLILEAPKKKKGKK